MTALTATELQVILEAQTYPYPIRFYTYVPKFPIYPYIVIRKQPPVSNTEDYTDVNLTDGFEITLFVRYTRGQDLEEQDQTTIESTILTTLDNTDFGTSAIYYESKQWNRVPIPRLYGSQSILRVSVTDKASTSGEGVLGSQMEIQTTLGNIQIFSLTSTEGNTLDSFKDDTGIIDWDFSGFEKGDMYFEYESNPTTNTIIKALTNGDLQNVTLVKGGTEYEMNVLFGITTKRGQYDKIERATTRFVVGNIIDAQKLSQFGVNAILI